MSDEIDNLIERKEAQLFPLCSRMEELKAEFTKATVDFALKWFRKTTKEYIAKNPEITLKMSEEKIANMKAAVNELVKNTENVGQAELNDSALWWHQKPYLHDPSDQYKQIADKYPEILDRAVRRALGHLGVVLEKFGFHVSTSDKGTYEEFWFERLPRSDQTVPSYPHLLSWTKEMEDIIRDYDTQFTHAIELYNEIQQLKEEKKRQEALTRWDSI